MSSLVKYRIREVAADFGMTPKEVSEIVGKYFEKPKSNTQVLEDAQLNVVFEYITRQNQVASLEQVVAATAKDKRPAPAAEKPQDEKPAAKQPAAQAQAVCDLLIANGIKAIWNFAPTHLDVPPQILVQNENMATSLAVLSKHLSAQMKGY